MLTRVALSAFFLLVAIVATAGAADASSLTVAWDPSADPNVAGYRVAFGVQSGVYATELDAGTQTVYQVDNLTGGVAYYFVVRAYDSVGNFSAPSQEVMGVAPLSTPLSISCPALTVTSSDGNPVTVTFSPTISGGLPPVTSTCTPPSGSQFPVGTTSVQCTATDAAGATATCTGAVVVKTRRHSRQ
jgi:hypothetical protein